MSDSQQRGLDIQIAGESSVILYLCLGSLQKNNLMVQQLCEVLHQHRPTWMIELVPAYHSVLVYFEPLSADHYLVIKHLKRVMAKLTTLTDTVGKQQVTNVALPVWYDAPIDNDLGRIAKRSGLSRQQVIRCHHSKTYQVYCLGFAPGFAFLGEVDETIAMPRLTSPRRQVPAGAVAIADRQTAVYPHASPGGWNIIGLCPTPLFDSKKQPCSPFAVGYTVTFHPIEESEFFALGGKD